MTPKNFLHPYSSKLSKLLDVAETYLREKVAPQANRLDHNTQALKLALQGLGDRSLLALTVPQSLGGGGVSPTNYALWQIASARVSGALAFLQTQHQSAASRLANSENIYLQQRYLSRMATGDSLIGVGFSHLRRRGKPMMSATEGAEGYLLTGEVPWITGWDYFDRFIIGANLADGREIYGLLPFQDTTQPTGGAIAFSQPLELIAMTATNTVTAKLNNWLLDRRDVLVIKPPGSIHTASKRNILHHGFFALGCAYAGLDILQTIGEQKQLDFIEESWRSLQQEVSQCVDAMLTSMPDRSATYLERLQLRSWSINLAQRTSQAAVIANSGGSNSLHSAAGRVYREALLFSVSGQTTDVMQTSLQQLIKN